MTPRYCHNVEAIPAQIGEPLLISISPSRLETLSADARLHLVHLVERGAVLHVRGVPRANSLDLAPFASCGAMGGRECAATAYRFAASRMLPAALAGEAATECDFRGYGAERIPAQAEELMAVREADGTERIAIFALRYGKGQVICDLQAESPDGAETPLVERMADPQGRHREVGALIAVDWAIGKDESELPPFNLTVDDRPVNFDHFNIAGVTALLSHIEEFYPGTHTDFAWTPRHASPSRGYLDVMRKFPTGFVWHGLYRHIDHRVIADPGAEFARGKRRVGEIEERFGVRLQRIMIFPFERTAAQQFGLLREAGFLACVEEPRLPRSFDPQLPKYLDCSLPSVIDPLCGFTVLNRYRVPMLSRDRMLAMAALGLPIIAYAHPDELGLRRFSRLWDRKEPSYFDPILDFALAKGLPSRSLEEIATEVKARAFVWDPMSAIAE